MSRTKAPQPAIEVFGDLDPALIGLRLRESRESRNMTQTQVAWAADLNLGNYNELEQGKRGPHGKTLYRLCQVLDVSADYLLGLSTDSRPQWRREECL